MKVPPRFSSLCRYAAAPAVVARVTRASAFTMVEIAISLAIIGFALVAIIGALPTGMTVQRDNREETIINQDASVFMDAIRHGTPINAIAEGATGLNDLTNYVYAITNYFQLYAANGARVGQSHAYGYTYYTSSLDNAPMGTLQPLTTGVRIIGLLSTPKYQFRPDGSYISNRVVAYVRAISGNASEKPPQSDPNVQSLAFSYRLIPEIVPVEASSPVPPSAVLNNLTANLHEVRLLFQWPVLPGGKLGSGRQEFRSMVGGAYLNNSVLGTNYWYFQPATYVKVP